MTTTVQTGQARPSPQTPPTRGRWPLGELPAFRRDPLDLFLRAMHEEGDLVKMRIGPRWSYIIYHPDYVQHVLVDNNRNYRRSDIGRSLLQLVSGENLLTSEGEFWRRQRRLMQPAFHRRRIAGFGDKMTRAAAGMLDRWAAHPTDEPLRVDVEMMQVTLRVVGEALFSVDLTADASALGRSITASSEYFAYRMNHLLAPPLWVPTPRNRALRRAVAQAAPIVPQLIAERRRQIAQHGPAEQAGRPYDFLDLLLDARYEDTGEGMDDEQLQREVRLMIVAGHETTANTLTWTLHLLSQHPDQQARLYEEVDRVLAGRRPTVADLADLPFTRMVIDESMRLYPPAWIMGRQTIEPDQLDPYAIPADVGVTIPIYAIHRHPAFWPEPERFDPDRFGEEHKAKRHRFAHFPFGGGPRLCIGRDFALMEAHLILAMIVQRFRLHPLPGYQAVPQPLITLRVRDGLPLFLAQR